MKTLLKYDTTNQKILQTKWNPHVAAKTESMMALGNGYLGLRSVDEEVTSYNKEDLFVNGVFNTENRDEVPELANLADSIQLDIYIDGVKFRLTSQDKYEKQLDIKTGSLTRKIIFTRQQKKFELLFERFVSQFSRHLYAQKITIKQLSGSNANLVVYPKINGQTTNCGAQHLAEGIKRKITESSIQYIEKTTFSDLLVLHNMILRSFLNNKKLAAESDNFLITMARRQVGFKINININKGDVFILEKLLSVNTSIDQQEQKMTDKDVQSHGDKIHKQLLATTYAQELKRSNQVWKKIYNQFFVKIEGDSKAAKYDSMANSFGVFHMNSFVPKDNSNLSVGAKGLSGEGYQGHAFWDTEFFINPNYLFTNPEVARNLLEYRYKGIQGARAKAAEKKERAAESNLKGAQYPWEMAWPTDGEVCPYWGQADVVTGKQVPIASRRQEIHVSADVAYAVHQYYDFTGDETFMNEMGYEMIFDTAIFWANRAEKQLDGRYAINDVMGPNEYKGNINNNAFINTFAKTNIYLALRYLEQLSKTPKGQKIRKQIIKKIPYKIPLKKMQDVAKNLIQQQPNKDGIIAENDTFLKLKRMNVLPFQLQGDAGKKLFNTSEGHKRLSGQIVKQADVVLLTYLLPQLYNKKVITSNFNFYEPITTHDSSLSPTTYAIQAIDLRKMSLAYKLYKYSLNIDMGPNMQSCDAGIHAGALAAIWQTTIFGYGGLRWIDGKLHINPIIPKQWTGLKYRVWFQNVQLEINVKRNQFTIKTLNEKSLYVYINNQKTKITSMLVTKEI